MNNGTSRSSLRRKVSRRFALGAAAAALATLIGGKGASAQPPSGQIWAWGANWKGQLGDGSSPALVPWSAGAVEVVGAVAGSGNHFIAAGNAHSLAVNSAGQVWTWGDNTHGQLGDGTTSDRWAPVHVAGTGTASIVVSAAGGNRHSLAITLTGAVVAWGSNANGALGLGLQSAGPLLTPATVPGLPPLMIQVAAGADHSLALAHNGEVWAWGNNAYGQLGNNSFNNAPSPVKVPNLSGVRFIAAATSGFSSFAVKHDGSVWAWGSNATGQLGVDPVQVAKSSVPLQVTTADPGTGNIAVAAGFAHCLALNQDGSVWAWGSNSSGQLGRPIGASSFLPVNVAGQTGGSGNIQIAAGAFHSVALKSNGQILAWGKNDTGQLGLASGADQTTPALVVTLPGLQQVAAGARHTMMLF